MATWYYLTKVMKSKSTKHRSETESCEFNIVPKVNFKNKVNLLDFSSNCRVCLKEGSVPMHGREDTIDIVETLKILTEVRIDEHDEKPKFLCAICYKFLKSASNFRKTAKLSEEILKRPFKEEKVVDHLEKSNYNENEYSDDEFVANKYLDDKWPNIKNDIELKSEKKEKIKYSTKVTCHICNKVINHSYYKEHITMHDPDHKKYVCDVCGKSFRLRCAYHNHSLRHRNDFPYKCSYCPYKGRYAELLKTHMRTHTGDYRYMCTECPARFLFKSNLNSHMLKHKEPQFKCDTCKRAFHTNLSLQRHHEADHLGIKNHVCNICGKAFGYRNAMMKHQRHVHKREKLLFGRMPAYLQAENDKQDMTM